MARRVVLLVAVFALLTAACGGSASDSSSDGTTTTTAAGALDPSAKEAAQQASVALADVGAGWTEYRKAGGLVKATEDACITEFGSPIKKSDLFHSGPMFRDPSETAFIYTYSYVFRTEADAKAYTTARASGDFTKCKEAADDKAQKQRDAKTFVRLSKPTDPAVGSDGLEAYYEELAGGTNADGTEFTNGSYGRYTYRLGRVVYVIQIDAGSPADDAAAQALGDRVMQALTTAKSNIDARVSTLDV